MLGLWKNMSEEKEVHSSLRYWPFCRRNIENAWKKGKMCGGVPKIVVFLPA
jgi:hypothetical protein